MTDADEALFEWDEPEDDDQEDGDGPPLEFDLADTNGPRIVTALPSGTESLVLTGPGAGRTVVSAALPPTEVPTHTAHGLQTRDEALSSRRALMIVHRPHQHRGDIPRLLASVLAATSGNISLGASVWLHTAQPTAHAAWFDDCAAASIRIADPACYLLDSSILQVKPISEPAKVRAPYLANQSPSINEVLDAQRAAGANLLLSPGRGLDPAGGQKSLDAVFAEASSALGALSAGERLALNLTLPAQWLISPTARTLLLDQLFEHDQFDVWHVRVQWPSGPSPYQQPVDPHLLEGYKKLANLAEDEERVLLLPQTGLTGWFQLGLGATGFGAGPWGSSHAFREDKERTGFGNNPEVQRYFEPALLHTVERSMHDVLSADPTYTMCDCPYCPALHDGSWNHRAAKLHQLHWLGRLAADTTSGRNPLSQVRQRVRAAQSSANNALLSGPNIPKHLQAWDPFL